VALFDADGAFDWPVAPFPPSTARGTHVMQVPDGRRWLVDAVLAPRAHLMLFGAGHVGAAIVRALAELPCRVTWVDEREDMFPAAGAGQRDGRSHRYARSAGRRAAPGTSFPRHDPQPCA
jgi:xanthine dehydrogenase accessory factor